MDNGNEMANQISTIASMVPAGIAPEEPALIKKKFKNMIMRNKSPGTSVGVKSILTFQFSPPKNL